MMILEKSISTTAPSQNIVSQSLHPIKFKEILLPTEMRKFNSKKYIFNLGKNIAGISEIKVRGRGNCSKGYSFGIIG